MYIMFYQSSNLQTRHFHHAGGCPYTILYAQDKFRINLLRPVLLSFWVPHFTSNIKVGLQWLNIYFQLCPPALLIPHPNSSLMAAISPSMLSQTCISNLFLLFVWKYSTSEFVYFLSVYYLLFVFLSHYGSPSFVQCVLQLTLLALHGTWLSTSIWTLRLTHSRVMPPG